MIKARRPSSQTVRSDRDRSPRFAVGNRSLGERRCFGRWSSGSCSAYRAPIRHHLGQRPGLNLVSDEPFALVFDLNGHMLRIAKTKARAHDATAHLHDTARGQILRRPATRFT